MGRPLKIAKAQTVLTITDTATTGSVVTVTQDLITEPNVGVMAGMPFVVASTVGGLTAGTTYYVNQILTNTTFSVSATQLSVQPQVMAPLTNTTGGSVSATVGLVDNYFNNPNGASNTYSVVGGNTALYGKQVLAQVAIGINGTGTIYSITSSADVWGIGTDFGNASPAIVAGTAFQAVNANINGTTNPVNLGFVSSLYNFSANVTATYANGYVDTDDNTGFNSNKPVYLTGNIGGLVANTPYFVTTIDGGGQLITLSTSPSGANVALTADSGTVPIIADAVTLTTNASANTVAPNGSLLTDYIYANDEAGFIVRQKGKQKYLVQGATTGLQAQCLTANVANTALTPNTMSIIATYANAATQRVQSLSDHTGELFTATSGPIASGNIVFPNAAPVFATFNAAAVANAANGMPYPLVQINNA